jgi:tetratricopeptide (TPR) repeat protein
MKSLVMKTLYTITALVLLNSSAFSQKSQVLIAKNSLAKLQVSISRKDDFKKQNIVIGEGLKAIELAQKDKKTINWPEVWAIKSYLNSYLSIIENNELNSEKFYQIAIESLEKAKKLDKYESSSKLINATTHNVNIKKQELGIRAYQQNDFSNAFNLLKQVSDYFANDTTLAVNTALCGLSTQNYDEALTYFIRAKNNQIKNPVVFQNIAMLYVEKFEPDLAIQTLEDGLKLNPNHPYLTNDYINLLLDNEKLDKAKNAIQIAVTNKPNNQLLYFLLGYLNQSNLKEAEISLTKALALDENYFEALYQLSLIYINFANNALKENKIDKFTHHINRAEFALLSAFEINTNDRNTIQLLIEIYTRKNRLDKVQDLKRKINEF